MDFLIDDDIRAFRDEIRSLVTTHVEPVPFSSFVDRKGVLSPDALRTRDDLGRGVLRKLGALGGIQGVLPEEHGGVGGGLRLLAMMLEEVGRIPSPVPLLESAALSCLYKCAIAHEEGGAPYISEALSGERVATGAPYQIVRAGLFKESLSTSLSLMAAHGSDKDEWKISGDISGVPSCEKADFLILPALTDGVEPRLGLFLVPSGHVNTSPNNTAPEAAPARAEGEMVFSCLSSPELTRSLWNVSLRQVVGVPMAFYSAGDASLLRLASFLVVSVVAEAFGGAVSELERAVEYVKTREQYGRPVGSFQAVQHALANQKLLIDQLGSLLRFTAYSYDMSSPQLEQASLSLLGLASESLPKVLESLLQLHGGVGFTFEYPLHLALRRAITLPYLLGSDSEAYSRVANLADG